MGKFGPGINKSMMIFFLMGDMVGDNRALQMTPMSFKSSDRYTTKTGYTEWQPVFPGYLLYEKI